jgi:hypothetical protein
MRRTQTRAAAIMLLPHAPLGRIGLFGSHGHNPFGGLARVAYYLRRPVRLLLLHTILDSWKLFKTYFDLFSGRGFVRRDCALSLKIPTR